MGYFGGGGTGSAGQPIGTLRVDCASLSTKTIDPNGFGIVEVSRSGTGSYGKCTIHLANGTKDGHKLLIRCIALQSGGVIELPASDANLKLGDSIYSHWCCENGSGIIYNKYVISLVWSTTASAWIEVMRWAVGDGRMADALQFGASHVYGNGAIGVGNFNYAADDFQAVFGLSHTQSGYATFVAGDNHDGDADYSMVVGRDNESNGNYSTVEGWRGQSSYLGEHVQGGMGASLGQSQYRRIILNSHFNAGQSGLVLQGGLSGGTGRLLLPVGVTWTFSILVTLRSDSGLLGGGFSFRGVITRNTGSTSTRFIGTPIKEILGKDLSAMDANIAASAVNELEINVGFGDGGTPYIASAVLEINQLKV